MNAVNQSDPKLTKIARTQLDKMHQNEHSQAKLTKNSKNPVSQNGPK